MLRKNECRTGVLLADHDPISRYVLGGVLRAADQAGDLRLLGCFDSLRPMWDWPALDRAQVVVLSIGPNEDQDGTIRALVARGIRVLLIGTRWDRCTLDRAIAAGATGCLIKDTEVHRLAPAALAVASGYVLLSPGLLDVYRTVLAQHRPQVDHSLTEREYEVLSLLAQGLSTEETAAELCVSPATVKSHVSHSLPKLGARNRLEAVLMVRRSEGGNHLHLTT